MDKRYVVLLVYRGVGICALKEAVPSRGDKLGYIIDHPHFAGQHFGRVQDALDAVIAFKGKPKPKKK